MTDYLLAALIAVQVARWASDSPRLRVGLRGLWRRMRGR